MSINPGNADRCTSCGQIRALLDLHDLTGQCPACFDRSAKHKAPGDHHPIVHALMSASYAAFDLGFYAKSDGFADEAASVRHDLKCNPHATCAPTATPTCTPAVAERTLNPERNP